MSTIGLTLCKGGASPQDTPSLPLAQALQLSLHPKIDKKLKNHRITSVADLMMFPPHQPNRWTTPLITSQFLLILEPFLGEPPSGHRHIKTGQSWSLELESGAQGHILEILGITLQGLVNVRHWVPLIPRTEWYLKNVLLHRRNARDNLWVHPEFPGLSRGAGFTVSLPTNIFGGRLLFMTLGLGQPTTNQDEDLVLHKDIARQVLFGSEEHCPSLPSTNVSPQLTHDPVSAVIFQKCSIREFEVFVDGSIRVPTTVLDHTFPQPKFHKYMLKVASFSNPLQHLLPPFPHEIMTSQSPPETDPPLDFVPRPPWSYKPS